MLNHVLQPDTQVILLLCAYFGQKRKTEPPPLTLSEYNFLAGWLQENQMRPADLLSDIGREKLQSIPANKLELHRLLALLERGVMLSLAVEKWTNQGLWILGRSDAQYPKRLKQKLRHSAPAILYGIGNLELLSQGGLAIVGSRDVDAAGLSYTQKIAHNCVASGMQVVSGGARGVDATAMQSALEAGGVAVVVLADSLSKAAVQSMYRAGIKEGRIILLSTYDPDAGFNIGNAMGRNKYIYALADYALVVSAAVGKGGTWAGAVEALERIKDVPVFVRIDSTVPEGNRQLLQWGAKPFPSEAGNKSLPELLAITASSWVKPIENTVEETPEQTTNILANEPLTGAAVDAHLLRQGNSPKDIYEAVLPFIINHLQQPKDAEALAKCLDVRKSQLQDWLNRAVAEGKVRKTQKPVAYVVNEKATQLSLLDTVIQKN